VIPVLLRTGSGLVKTRRFREPKYIGDPLNAVKIFSEKEADELCFLDISATPEGRGPDLELLREVAEECFMPLACGGGIRTLEQVKSVLEVGVEKVVICSAAVEQPGFVRAVAEAHGSSTVIVAIDVARRRLGGYEVRVRGGREGTKLDPVRFAVEMDAQGAGELLLTAIDRDGTLEGYDLELIRRVSAEVGVPVVACGGAGCLEHLADSVAAGAAAAAVGSMFVLHGKHRAVLITYPERKELEALFPPDAHV
jgi:imidazole glycerol-phosphate synthase subunit HisF